ncbi:hypothetical protein PR202_ga13961 [Eleusine coracana subsp. coracana]|uniref:F-box associated beta-propeller type 3 domain-containing protein n=1 Tax=Eleusine coracana subsp. coracana TaxID=191504 RepID=A0AAV5CG24_ELECO|nr:hypothetical protein PR202_ga13961 [Eleusine coracana subsp. coracana]
MEEKQPGEEDEIPEAQKNAAPAATRKRKRKRKRKKRSRTKSSASASPCDVGIIMCDDVLRNIFARLPARTVVASMALSKHHRRLMCCPDFRNLHCRLGPPDLPRPHIAYVTTAKIIRRKSGGRDPVSGFHGFHIADGSNSAAAAAPMRSLVGETYLNKRYVNTCNGFVLLAGGEPKPTTCVLWNPAVADEEKEVTVPISACDDCVILGLGYGRRSHTYKLLLSRRRKRMTTLQSNPPITRHPKELLVYRFGATAFPVMRTVSTSSSNVDGEISNKSLHIDGVIYLLHVFNSVILAFDVDNETVTTIDLPGEHNPTPRPMSNLMELSGRPCVETFDGNVRALWLLTEDHRWERRCVVTTHHPVSHHDGGHLNSCFVAGAWDCDGVLVMYLHNADGGDHRLCMKNASTNKTFDATLPSNVTPEWPDYAFCWGYKPTLLSPGSIVGNKLSKRQERLRKCAANVMKALKPVNERERRKGAQGNAQHRLLHGILG